MIIIVIISLILSSSSLAGTTSVSKCFYEGDFTVYCNKSRLSAAAPTELMRYARLTNGVMYGDAMCSYNASSCHTKQSLSDCVDKAYCHVPNSWSSMAPNCNGNSYYSQLDYDCHPAYTMCDTAHTLVDGFSGLIYSPDYPNTFRSDQRRETCYLTINLPKNHHVEITLDFFDMLKTPNCYGDYLEIQQYVRVGPTTGGGNNNGDNGVLRNKYLSNKRYKSTNQQSVDSEEKSYFKNSTGGQIFYNAHDDDDQATTISSTTTRQKPVVKLKKSNRRVGHLSDTGSGGKMFRPQSHQSTRKPSNSGGQQNRRPAEYKWHTLVTVCGKLENGYVIRGTASTINFKFRPLAANHPLLNNNPNRHQGFKIFFQAVPPKLADDEETVVAGGGKLNVSATSNRNSTVVITTKEFDILGPDREESDADDEANSDKQRKTILKMPYWVFILLAILIALIIIGAVLVVVIFVVKKRNNKLLSSAKYSKSEPIASKTPAPATSKPNGAAVKPTTIPISKPIASSLKPPGSGPKMGASGGGGSGGSSPGPKVTLMEQEPRKMQAERPLLLQDLSQSRLLAKFKQETASTPTQTAAAATTAPTTSSSSQQALPTVDTTVAVKSSPTEPKAAVTTSAASNSGVTNNNNMSAGTPSKSGQLSASTTRKTGGGGGSQLGTPQAKKQEVKPTLLNSGIYGVEAYEEAGVYGADLPVVPKSSSSSVSANATPPPAKPATAMTTTSTSATLVAQTSTEKKDQGNEEEVVEESKKSETTALLERKASQKDGTIVSSSTSDVKTSHRKQHAAAFNPLHVILKDKNKYHTTEYI